MSFVYPSFLWALLLIVVPILIHLFHFRRFKVVYFTNVRFLKDIKEEQSNRKKIRDLLVLLSRIFALIFLVFAFAQPFIADKNLPKKEGSTDVSIYIDNSFSMSLENEGVRFIEIAKARAEEIISAYGANDRFQILSSDFEGRDQRLLSKDDAIARIRELQLGYQSKDFDKVLQRQKNALETGDNKNKELFYISDFQKNSLQGFENKDSISLYLIPIAGSNIKNLSVDTIWFESPVHQMNQPNSLIVKVKNHSDLDASDVNISLDVDGEKRPGGKLEVPAKGFVYDTLSISVSKTGFHKASIQINDYPVAFDNTYFFNFKVEEQIDILEIFETKPDPYIGASFKRNTFFKMNQMSVKQMDFSQLKNYELIILQGIKNLSSGLAAELNTFISEGGNVLIFPAENQNMNDYNSFLKQIESVQLGAWESKEKGVNSINYDDYIFQDVFTEKKQNLKLPSTQGQYKIKVSNRSGSEDILSYRDGSSFLTKTKFNLGYSFVCAAPIALTYSNLVQNSEIFIPMLYRLSMMTGKIEKLAYTMGKDLFIETRVPENVGEAVLRLRNDKIEFIPEQRTIGTKLLCNVSQLKSEAGFYGLFAEGNAEVLDVFSFNYDRKESEMQFFTKKEIEGRMQSYMSIVDGTYAKDFSSILSVEKKGWILWKYCLLLVLLFLALETALLRLWK